MAASTLVAAAVREARRLGHGTIGPPHLVLAVLRGEDCAAKRALIAMGLTPERYESGFAQVYRTEAVPLDGWISSNPRFLAVDGAARAFAATAGRPEPDAADALLGVLYADAWRWGVDDTDTPGRVVTALAEEGVRVPAVPPPEHRPWRDPCSTEVVPELVPALLDLLLERHPPGDGPQWGCKPLADGRQVVVHEAELDVALLVAEAERRGRRL